MSAGDDIESALDAVAKAFEVDKAELRQWIRRKDLNPARWCAWSILRDVCGMKYKDIAKAFGFKSHAGVMQSIERLKELERAEPLMKQRVDRAVLSFVGVPEGKTGT